MVKTLSHAKKNKNFTTRLDPEVADGIRLRAPKLGMSQSYYITCLYRLDMKYNLLNELPDPLAAADEEKVEHNLDPAEAAAMIERLRSGGFIAPEPVATTHGNIPPVAPAVDPKTKKSVHQRPVMRTREDLLKIAQGGPAAGTPAEIQAALRGSVGDVQMQIRNAQLKATQEERADREMRKRILEEQAEDLSVAELDDGGDEDGS